MGSAGPWLAALHHFFLQVALSHTMRHLTCPRPCTLRPAAPRPPLRLGAHATGQSSLPGEGRPKGRGRRRWKQAWGHLQHSWGSQGTGSVIWKWALSEHVPWPPDRPPHGKGMARGGLSGASGRGLEVILCLVLRIFFNPRDDRK